MSASSTADIVVGGIIIANALVLAAFCGRMLWKLHLNERNHPWVSS